MNCINLIGRLTKDADLKITASDMAICKFSIAVDRDFKGKDGNKETDFFNCTLFKNMATNLSPYLTKGKLIGLTGRVQLGSYTKKDSDARVNTCDVMVSNIQFLEKKSDSVDAVPVDDGDIPF